MTVGTIENLLREADAALNEEFPPNIEAAHRAFQEALSIDPNCVEALDAFGEMLANLGETERAVEVLSRSVQIAPNTGAMKYFYLGQMLQGTEALEAYRRCIALLEVPERCVPVYCAIGELFMTDLCDEEEAEQSCHEAFRRALAINPESVEALNGIATFHRIKLEIPQSKEYASKAFSIIDAVPEDAELDELAPFPLRQRLAQNLTELEMVDEALGILATLFEEDDEDIQSWFLTGCCHLVGKQREEGLECVAHAKKLMKKNRAEIPPHVLAHWTKNLSDLEHRLRQI